MRSPRPRRAPSARSRRARSRRPRAARAALQVRHHAALIAAPAPAAPPSPGPRRPPAPAWRGSSRSHGQGCAAAGCRRPRPARDRERLPVQDSCSPPAVPQERAPFAGGHAEDGRSCAAPSWVERGSRPGARSAGRSAAGTARRRCASGRRSHRPRRPRPRCRARGASCRPASRSRCPRSSARKCRRSRSSPRRRAARPGRCRDRPQQPQRLVADPQHPQRVAGRVVGDPVRVVRADVGHPEHVDQQFGQLVGPRRPRASPGRPGPRRRAAGNHRVLVPHRPHTRAGRRHHDLDRRLGTPRTWRRTSGSASVRVAGVDVHLAGSRSERAGTRPRARAAPAARPWPSAHRGTARHRGRWR